jgi:GNAT superfamily N-acetyltransferase
MKAIPRKYQTDQDFWHIREFLRQVFLLNQRRMLSWPVVRMDYWRWHGIMNLGDGGLEEDVYLWENEAGQLVAVINREEAGNAFLHIHPAWNSADLEEQMIVQAEEKLRIKSRKGGMALWIWCDSLDHQRQGILERRGYTRITGFDEHQWLRDLAVPIPDRPVREGYTIRSLGDITDLPSRSWASWRAFHPDEPDEKYEGWDWYLNIQSAPLYRRDLDLVAIAPGGEVAAFTTAWYDDVTRCGCFEPVGTVPEHQRLGLASAILYEGMRRLQRMGATQAMTSGYEPPANGLYLAMLGPVFDLSQPWEKRWA